MNRSTTDTSDEVVALKDELAKIRHDVSSLAGAVMSRGKESAKAVGDAVKHRVNSSIETLGSLAQERPLTTVMVAFAAGAVAMLLLRRK